jgi:hypothetical protein
MSGYSASLFAKIVVSQELMTTIPIQESAVAPSSNHPTSKGFLSDRSRNFLKEGAKILGVGALKIVSRMLFWGAVGLFLGASVFGVEIGTGLLSHPNETWTTFRWALVAVYAAAGAGILGYVGLWRGLGRTLIHVGVERGFVSYLVETIFHKMSEIIRRSDKVSGLVDRGETALQNIPLDRAEAVLKQAINDYISSDDLEGEVKGIRRRLLRMMKKILCHRIEAYLLSIVRAERTQQGGGGVSMEKVRQVALTQADHVVQGAIVSLMNKKLILMIVILLILLAIPAITIALV